MPSKSPEIEVLRVAVATYGSRSMGKRIGRLAVDRAVDALTAGQDSPIQRSLAGLQ